MISYSRTKIRQSRSGTVWMKILKVQESCKTLNTDIKSTCVLSFFHCVLSFADSHNMYDGLSFYVGLGLFCVVRHLSDLRLHKPLGLLWGHFCTLWLWHCLQFVVFVRNFVMLYMSMSIDCAIVYPWVLHNNKLLLPIWATDVIRKEG